MEIQAIKLTTKHMIYDIQVEGEVIETGTPVGILQTWNHGDGLLITVLTRRGYVEYHGGQMVRVA